MKAIQVSFDEELLRELDATEEVRRDGRSSLMRLAVAEYLDRRRQAMLAQQYRNAYEGELGLGEEFAGWEGQGSWPRE